VSFFAACEEHDPGGGDRSPKGDLRIIMQQRSAKDGSIMRSWKGGPPNGTNMGEVFTIRASQDGKPIPVEINYDKGSGAACRGGRRNSAQRVKPSVGVGIECSSAEGDAVVLEGKVFEVTY